MTGPYDLVLRVFHEMAVLEEVARLIVLHMQGHIGTGGGILSRCCLLCGEGGLVSWYWSMKSCMRVCNSCCSCVLAG